MENHLQFFQWTRANILELLNSLTVEQVNFIPDGFKNNIVWNAGHIHAAQQFLVYKLAGLGMDLTDEFFNRYISGSPEMPIEKDEFESIKLKLQLFAHQTVEDHAHGRFVSFEPFKGNYFSIDYHFQDWQTAFQYNNLHEAWHLGYMMALGRAITPLTT